MSKVSVCPKSGVMKAGCRKVLRHSSTIVVFLLVVSSCRPYAEKTAERSHRVDNVRKLSDEYREMRALGEIPTLDNLTQRLLGKGVSLWPVNLLHTNVPCYRVCPLDVSDTSPSTILVEETTNIALHGYLVRAYLDGSIRVENKPGTP